MSLIICPDCKKQVSDKAKCCPNCGCPISPTVNSSNKSMNHQSDGLNEVKIRCLSTDRACKYLIFCINGSERARGAIGTVVKIRINKPTRISVRQKFALLTSGDTGSFTAEPGKCYEALYTKPGLAVYKTIISEVSIIS